MWARNRMGISCPRSAIDCFKASKERVVLLVEPVGKRGGVDQPGSISMTCSPPAIRAAQGVSHARCRRKSPSLSALRQPPRGDPPADCCQRTTRGRGAGRTAIGSCRCACSSPPHFLEETKYFAICAADRLRAPAHKRLGRPNPSPAHRAIALSGPRWLWRLISRR